MSHYDIMRSFSSLQHILALVAVCCEPVSVKISFFPGKIQGISAPEYPLLGHQIAQYRLPYPTFSRSKSAQGSPLGKPYQ